MGALFPFIDYLSVLIIVQHVFAGGRELTDLKCDSPLGMESNKISDGDLTASSSYVNSVSPVHARVRVDKGGGAWCPSNVIKAGVKEWLEVNLNSAHLITGLETQGRYGKGQGQEFAEAFRIEYWRESSQDWMEYKNATGGTILSGNANPWHSVKQSLDNPIVASKVRFIPHSLHPRTVCMRVEVYGCKWDNGLESYEMDTPRVQRYGFYDGSDKNGRLVKGLGVLTDGVVGTEENLLVDSDETGPSSQWVIWTPEVNIKSVSVLFRFRSFRKFSSVTVHLASGSGFLLPALISIGVLGRTTMTSVKPVSSEGDVEIVTKVVIALNGVVSDNLKIDFVIGSQNLAISEVSFDADVYTGDFSKIVNSFTESTSDIAQTLSTSFSSSNTIITVQRPPPTEKKVSTDQSVQIATEDYRTYIAILAAVLTVGAVLTMVLLIWLSVKCFQSKKDGATQKGCWDKWCKRRTVQPSSELYGFARMSGESDSDTSSTLYHEPYRVTTVPLKGQVLPVVQQEEIESLMRRDCGIMLTPRGFQTQPNRSIGSQGISQGIGISRYPFQQQQQVAYSPYTTPTKMLAEKHYASSNILKVYEPTTCVTTAGGNYTLTSGRYS